jgi:hypothetical protein
MLIALLFRQQPGAPPPTGVLSGTVLYSDGTPAAAQVLNFTPLTEAGAPQGRGSSVRSDPGGNFSGRALPGRYLIQTTGATAVFYPGVLSPGSATPVVVTSGSVTSGLNFALPLSASGVRLQGRVTLPANYPVPAATFQVSLGRNFAPARPIAEDGTFEFTHVMDLVGAGLLDGTFNSAKSGFNYSLIAIGMEYAAAAIPVSPAAARYGFYSTPDASSDTQPSNLSRHRSKAEGRFSRSSHRSRLRQGRRI